LGPKDRVRLSWIPTDPRFRKPGSGWNWQIIRVEGVVAQSRSLVDTGINLAAGRDWEFRSALEFVGPFGQRLRGAAERLHVNDGHNPLTVIVTGPAVEIDWDVASFTKETSVILAVLGLGLLGVVIAQVMFGLRPLRWMHDSLNEIRRGRQSRLEDDCPTELQPLVEELNGLLDHNTALIERARSQADDLAHALKNPLTVIGNEVGAIEEESRTVIREQVAHMHTTINRYSSQARTAGTVNLLGAPIDVTKTLIDLKHTLDRLYQDRGLTVRLQGCHQCFFRGEERDLEEMLGNLMDNACKWATSLVVVDCQVRGPRLHIAIDDDGPGIPGHDMEVVTERGARLDQAKPGSGLGLSIVQDIATIYKGVLRLTRSVQGGLRAELELPAAHETITYAKSTAGSTNTLVSPISS
ncbi:MAG: ATP-binding protein, partial [Gammaproteobacteria bacterium]|nr:ATP-binding protein [Gammaproteobacteria bacterium]